MEGLIPFLIRAVKNQRPEKAYRCLSNNSNSGRSYHLLIGGAADSDGSSRGHGGGNEFRPSLLQV
ncbi:hypothetical protein M569_16266, partial [Genlisea aurea]